MSLELVKLGTSHLTRRLAPTSTRACTIESWACVEDRATSLDFGNSWLISQKRYKLQPSKSKTDRKSYVACRMAAISMSSSDLQSYFCCLKLLLTPIPLKINGTYINYVMLTRDQKAHVVCNFSFLIENEGQGQRRSRKSNVVISRKWCEIETLLLLTIY